MPEIVYRQKEEERMKRHIGIALTIALMTASTAASALAQGSGFQHVRAMALSVHSIEQEACVSLHLQCAAALPGGITVSQPQVTLDGLPLDVLRMELLQKPGNALALAVMMDNAVEHEASLSTIRGMAGRLLDGLGANDRAVVVPAHAPFAGLMEMRKADDSLLRDEIRAIAPAASEGFAAAILRIMQSVRFPVDSFSTVMVYLHAGNDVQDVQGLLDVRTMAQSLGIQVYVLSVQEMVNDDVLDFVHVTGGFALPAFTAVDRNSVVDSVLHDLRRGAVRVSLFTPLPCTDGESHDVTVSMEACGMRETHRSTLRLPAAGSDDQVIRLRIPKRALPMNSVVRIPILLEDLPATHILPPFAMEFVAFPLSMQFQRFVFTEHTILDTTMSSSAANPPTLRLTRSIRVDRTGVLCYIECKTQDAATPGHPTLRVKQFSSASMCAKADIVVQAMNLIPQRSDAFLRLTEAEAVDTLLRVKLLLIRNGEVSKDFDATGFEMFVDDTRRAYAVGALDTLTGERTVEIPYFCFDGALHSARAQYIAMGWPALGNGLGFSAMQKPRSIAIHGSTHLCPGDSVLLDAGGGFGAYLWSRGDTTRTITVRGEGSYHVRVTAGSEKCAPEFAPVLITQRPISRVDKAPMVRMCRGKYVDLTVLGDFNEARWNTGAIARTVRVTRPGLYYAHTVDADGCTQVTDSVLVVEADSLQPLIRAVGPATLCPGGTVVLELDQQYADVHWSNGWTGPTLVVDSPGAYHVRVIDPAGCSGSASFTIEAANHFKPRLRWSGSERAFCPGDSMLLWVEHGGASRRWSTGDTSSSVWLREAGAVFVAVEYDDCTAYSDTLEVYHFPAPPMPVIVRRGDTLRLEDGQPCRWYVNGMPIWGADQRWIIAPGNGQYTARVWGQHGCSTLSLPFDFQSSTAVQSLTEQAMELLLYPQPASDVIAIQIAPTVTGVRGIVLFDLLGREVRRSALDTSILRETVHVPIHDLRPGPYVLTVEHARGVLSRIVLIK